MQFSTLPRFPKLQLPSPLMARLTPKKVIRRHLSRKAQPNSSTNEEHFLFLSETYNAALERKLVAMDLTPDEIERLSRLSNIGKPGWTRSKTREGIGDEFLLGRINDAVNIFSDGEN